MNLMHLKYAVEIAQTGSISKAAENLFIGQPNLSRAMKELEHLLGITVFNRTSKGIIVTNEGAEFLSYARAILSQIEEVEAIYERRSNEKNKFSISIPRASYISEAFCELVNEYKNEKNLEFYFKETNSQRAINNIINSNYNLGIIRFQKVFEQYFQSLLKEKGLESKDIYEYEHIALMSAENALASKEVLMKGDFCDYTEIIHGDPYIPTMTSTDITKMEIGTTSTSHIFLFERGSQYDLLTNVNTTYMWASPIPEAFLIKNNLVQRECVDYKRIYKDVLIFKKGYRFSQIDMSFIEKLAKYRRNDSDIEEN